MGGGTLEGLKRDDTVVLPIHGADLIWDVFVVGQKGTQPVTGGASSIRLKLRIIHVLQMYFGV